MFQKIMLYLLKNKSCYDFIYNNQDWPTMINVLLLIINSLTLGAFDQEMLTD